MTIIGLVGLAGSGKDTTARIIQELLEPSLNAHGMPEHPLTCYSFRFADTLKAFVGHVFDWDEEWTHGNLKETEDTRYDRTEAIQMARARDQHLFEEFLDSYAPDSVIREAFVSGFIDFLDEKHAAGFYGPDYLTSRFAQQHIGTEGFRWCWPDAWVQLTMRNVAKVAHDSIVLLTDVRFPNEAQAILDAGGVLWRTTRDAGAPRAHASEAHIESITPDLILDNNGDLRDLRAQVADGLQHLLETRDPVTGRVERPGVTDTRWTSVEGEDQ